MLYAGMQTADNRKIASANFVHTISNDLNTDRYRSITTAIGSYETLHPSNTQILKDKGGQFTEADIDDYISKFDEIADLWRDNLVDEQMAYNEFSYSAEKAWCNNDVRNYIKDSRKADKIYTGNKAFYIAFEMMTRRFLVIDGKTCSDLDKE